MMIGCNINYDVCRPDRALVEGFRGLSTANIDDNMSRTAAISGGIRPLNRAPLLGTAFTVKVPAGDNLMLHKAMDLAEPGDVLVIDAGGYSGRAIIGELMTTYCKVRGLAGVVLDGCVRDCAALENMDFPVYARGASPNGPYKNGPGEINTPVQIGGVVVTPGDILVGDGDGVVVIHPGDAAQIIAQTKAVSAKEEALMKGILKGEYLRPWVDQKLTEIGCSF